MPMQLIDAYQRKFYYLRLSITEVCNFRCQYCLPNGYQFNGTHSFLSLPEIKRIVRAFTSVGTRKIRFTGGEPTLRRDFIDIIAGVRENPALKTIAVTTNGYRMARDVRKWKEAGLTAINVSVDSLDARQFYTITGQDKFKQVMDGIDAAFASGFATVKVNTVLMQNINAHQLPQFLSWIKHRPIQLRFIELMETGVGQKLFQQHYVSGKMIQTELLNMGWQRRDRAIEDGPAEVYYHADYQGEVGLIMPYSAKFCLSCNRLRVSSLGKLHLCLFGEEGINLRNLLVSDQQQSLLIQRIQASLQHKQQHHFLHQGVFGQTQSLSFIGG